MCLLWLRLQLAIVRIRVTRSLTAFKRSWIEEALGDILKGIWDISLVAVIAEMMVSKPLILAVSSSMGSERSDNTVGKLRASRFLIAGLVAEEGRTKRDIS